jgi:epidermal growth factor receptor substrate 15
LPSTTGFKPFMPTSAFGASLAQQTTGGSAISGQATGAPRGQQQTVAPSAARASDDLLGDSDIQAQESSKFNSDTSELANMSSQIGNLRGQMEQTQAKKSSTQAELATSNAQKNDLEIRLKQFRQQYENEVRLVKDLESQLSVSRESSKQLGQELAMLEGSYQDLQARHQTAAQALQTDQRENADLKTRIATVSAEVSRLKTEVEKMKLDARQQKGLVSINKKQLATNETERDRLQNEKEDLSMQARVVSEQSRAIATPDTFSGPTAAPPLASPAESLSVTNPFARKAGQENGLERASSPFTPLGVGSASAPSAFDTLFGPSTGADAGQARSGVGPPPVTSFGRSASSTAGEGALSEPKAGVPDAGEPNLPVTPPSTDRAKELQYTGDASSPPPPPEGKQFTASQLPIINLERKENDSETRSTQVRPPASRAGEPDDSPEASSVHGALSGSGLAADDMPGAFPAVPSPSTSTSQLKTQAGKDDFDAAFADFEEDQHPHGVASGSSRNATGVSGSAVEFPPIQSLEHDDEEDSDDDSSDDDDDERARTGFDDDFTATTSRATPAAAQSLTLPASSAIAIPALEGPPTPLPTASAQPSPPTYEQSHLPSHGGSGSGVRPNQVPPEFDGLLPSREDPTVGTSSTGQSSNEGISASAREVAEADRSVVSASELGRPLFPPSRANTNDVFHDASSRPISSIADTRAIPDTDQASTNTDILDEFDDFADLAEAKEANKSGNNDIDFGFDRAETAEFNPVFDSPAASMTNTVVSSQQTPVVPSRSLNAQDPLAGGLQSSKPAVRALDYTTNGSGDERGPQATTQHDWDSIFAGLDNSKTADTSSDPWSSVGPSASQAKPQQGSAVTPGTEHDDPILKRLTGMGYPRKAALDALEKYDYDINRVSDTNLRDPGADANATIGCGSSVRLGVDGRAAQPPVQAIDFVSKVGQLRHSIIVIIEFMRSRSFRDLPEYETSARMCAHSKVGSCAVLKQAIFVRKCTWVQCLR